MTPVIHLPPLTGDAGGMDRYPAFSSRYVIPRTVDIWRPSNNRTDSAIRYPVLYLHDGQNLFDPALSFDAGCRIQALSAAHGSVVAGRRL